MQETTDTIEWTPDAEARLKKAPFFLRGMVRKLSEKKGARAGDHEDYGGDTQSI